MLGIFFHKPTPKEVIFTIFIGSQTPETVKAYAITYVYIAFTLQLFGSAIYPVHFQLIKCFQWEFHQIAFLRPLISKCQTRTLH